MTIGEAIARFLDAISTNSEQTRRSYATPMSHLAAFLVDLGISSDDDVSRLPLPYLRDFSAWLVQYRNQKTGQPLAKNTRSLYLIAASLFFRHLIVDKLIDADLKDYDNLRGDLKVEMVRDPIAKKLPTTSLVNAILETANIEPEMDESRTAGDRRRARLSWLRDRAIVHCLYSSGARVGELSGLRCGDLRPEDQGAWVRGKGAKARIVNFSLTAWQALDAYLEERGDRSRDLPLFCRHDRRSGSRYLPLSTRSMENLIAGLAEKTDLAKDFPIHPHSFRHYFATRLLRHTGDLALTQDALGHADPATTRIYAKTDNRDIKEAHREIFDEEQSNE